MSKSTGKAKREDSAKQVAKNLFAALEGKRTRSSKSSPHHKKRDFLKQINLRAVIKLSVVVVVVAGLYYPVRLLQGVTLRRSALAQIRALTEKGQVDLALVNLRSYLAEWPDDIPGLSLMGELITDHPWTPDRVVSGSQTLDRLLRLDADSPERQVDRKRLVQL